MAIRIHSRETKSNVIHSSFPHQVFLLFFALIVTTLLMIRISLPLVHVESAVDPMTPQLPNHVLAITQRGDYLLTDWPTSNLLENDFTIEIWYKTPIQPNNNETVALISNLRDLQDAEGYGRDFGIYLDGVTGKIRVEFHGYQPVERSFAKGTLSSHKRIDDGQWHLLRLIRNGQEAMGNLTLAVDGSIVDHAVMPIQHDYDSQEQRVVIGGGNGQAFRHCQLDNIRIWSRVVDEPPIESSPEDPTFIMHLSFDDVTEGVAIQDCAWHGNGAIRMGTTLRMKSAFVPATLPNIAIAPMTRCSSWPGMYGKKLSKPNSDTTRMISYLGVDCEQKGVWFEKGGLYEMEAYIAGLWLDANRLGMPLLILTECVDASFRKNFATQYVTFREVQNNADVATRRDGDTFEFQIPPKCQHNAGGLAYMKRFLVFEQLLSQGLYRKDSDYLVHIDLRDARAYYWPNWRHEGQRPNSAPVRARRDRGTNKTVVPPSTAPAVPQLWLQSIRQSRSLVCGGFQSGTYAAMHKLLQVMKDKIVGQGCDMGNRQNDQTLLIQAYGARQFGTDIALDAGIVNSQKTRRFDNETAFAHGNWWMSKKSVKDSSARKAYPNDVPYYPSSRG